METKALVSLLYSRVGRGFGGDFAPTEEAIRYELRNQKKTVILGEFQNELLAKSQILKNISIAKRVSKENPKAKMAKRNLAKKKPHLQIGNAAKKPDSTI